VNGTGLGLLVCKSIVELHGGQIFVETALGIGSRFFFELPISRGRGVDTGRVETGRVGCGRVHGLQILCVEDVHGLAGTSLRRHGATVNIVTSAGEALMMASVLADEVEVVVIDLDVIGSAVARFLATLRERSPNVRVLVMSGFPPDHPIVARAVTRSGARYLEKQVDPERLLDAVESLVASCSPE